MAQQVQPPKIETIKTGHSTRLETDLLGGLRVGMAEDVGEELRVDLRLEPQHATLTILRAHNPQTGWCHHTVGMAASSFVSASHRSAFGVGRFPNVLRTLCDCGSRDAPR